MRPDPEKLWDPLGGAGGVQDHGPVQRIGQPLVQVVQHETHALRGDQSSTRNPAPLSSARSC